MCVRQDTCRVFCLCLSVRSCYVYNRTLLESSSFISDRMHCLDIKIHCISFMDHIDVDITLGKNNPMSILQSKHEPFLPASLPTLYCNSCDEHVLVLCDFFKSSFVHFCCMDSRNNNRDGNFY